jgi:hypothetical protein
MDFSDISFRSTPLCCIRAKKVIVMLFEMFLETPLPLLFLATFILLCIAFEGGVFLGKKHRVSAAQEDRAPISSIVAATLGLLAFLLAFTFGIAATKFEERRGFVVEEANAIGTTYLRAGYLSVAAQEEIRTLFKEYVAIRIEAITAEKLTFGIKRSEEIQDRLWAQAQALAKETPESVVLGLFISSLNDVIDLHAKRVNVGVRIRIPLIIWFMLYSVAILAIGSVGYQIGLSHTRYVGISLLLILCFACVLTLIIDLDRPGEGFIRVSQQPLIELLPRFKAIDHI